MPIIRPVIGTGAWHSSGKENFRSPTVSTTGLTSGDFYWVNLRASDGDRMGTASVKICYKTGGGTCASDAAVHGQNLPEVGIET